jgi:uncharacterized Tic20 family protein
MTSPETEKESRMWAMFVHLALLVPCIGVVISIVLWQIKKSDFPEIDVHGKNAANFIISVIIYSVGIWILTFLGIGFLLFPILYLLFPVCMILAIIAGIKANNGEVWKYPIAIEFIK